MPNRGPDAHLVPFASADIVCNEPCLETLP
jgi:hypothetical protein